MKIESKDLFCIAGLESYRDLTSEQQYEANEIYDNSKGSQKDRLKLIKDHCDKTLEENKRKNKVERKNISNGLPVRFANKTFNNFVSETKMQNNALAKAKEYVKNIDKYIVSGTCMIFAGNGSVGTGKTHMVCAIANEVLKRGYEVKFINSVQMLSLLKKKILTKTSI